MGNRAFNEKYVRFVADSLRGHVTDSRLSERTCDRQSTKFLSTVCRVYDETEDGCCCIACFEIVNCTSFTVGNWSFRYPLSEVMWN
jgi:hypothetical protein